VPASTLARWMTLGEANVKCWTEGVAALDWRGALYQRMTRAVARAQSPVLKKLHEQAKDEGGRTAVDFLKLRFFENQGYLSSAVGRGVNPPSGISRDIGDQEGTAKDMPSAEDALAAINAALSNALAAARARASAGG